MSTLYLVFGGTSPAFIDDDARAQATNGVDATASLLFNEIALANQLAHAGRSLYSWSMSTDVTPIGATEITSCFRQVYIAANKGADSESGEILGLAHEEEVDPGFQTGQGFDVAIGSTTAHAYWNYSTSPEVNYATDMRVVPFASSFGYSTVPAELIIGGVTTDWPLPVAGSFWQDPDNAIDSDNASTAGVADLRQKGEIIATRDTGVEQLTSLVNVVRDTWFHQRPQCGWSTVLPGLVDAGSSAIRGVHLGTSPQAYRFIFDQTYGTGGTTITATTPAMSLPLANSAGGLRRQVRVYVFVYAAMSGGTDHGAIGVANKNSVGTMGAPTTLTNGPTISGTTFQWYPTLATWNATTAPYFLGYTGDAYDRVALCARSDGPSDEVIVGAFTFVVAPATS